MDKELINYLKCRRIELNLTMKDVAEIVGVSEGTVSRWESGCINNMRRDRIMAYAKALRVTPDIIMGRSSCDTIDDQIINNIKSLDYDQKKEVLSYIEYIMQKGGH